MSQGDRTPERPNNHPGHDRPAAAIAAYWDRAAVQMSGAQQFAASASELGGDDCAALIADMRAIQARISHARARWQGLLPRGHG